MPTYQYECSGCGHALEVFQSMNDKRLTKCPECKKNKLQRLIGTGSGIIFKGSGFYETDYKQKPAPAGAAKGASGKQKPGKEGKSESPTGHGCSPSCGCAAGH